MNLNLFDNHLSYIKNINAYTHKHQCRNCDKLFKTLHKCKLHEPKCHNTTKYQFPGGYFNLSKTIFERLEEYGINTNPEERFNDWFLCFDFESLLIKLDSQEEGKLKFTQYHHPVSVSICSNVDGYREARCFIDNSLEHLLKQMKMYMSSISNKVKLLALEKWRGIFEELKN